MKAVVYFFIILVPCLVVLIAAEVIFTKTQFGRERFNKNIDPEPYVATTNKQGFRARTADVIYGKNSGGYFRIICLGDSFTYGHGVADDKTYPVFLEKYLEGIYQRKAQVINAGVCGATITEELDMYTNNCAQLQHDLAILLFHWRDISGDFTRLLLFKTKERHDWGTDKFLHWSKVYSLIKLKILQQQESYAESYYKKHKEYIINKYLENVRSLNRMVKSKDAVLVVVIFSDEADDKILKNFCMGENISVIDIHKEYAERAAKGGILLAYHHNEAGNDFLAKLIAQKSQSFSNSLAGHGRDR